MRFSYDAIFFCMSRQSLSHVCFFLQSGAAFAEN